MPGIENFAPERTDTSNGLVADPSVALALFSSRRSCATISSSMAGVSLPPLV